MILEKIKQPNDIHKVALADFPVLAEEIRAFLLQAVSKTGGHLASNLGAVELTMALHNVLQFPEDKIIWDVGHQAYTHKILTGRKDDFSHLRQEGGLSGFPKRSESPCDSFDTGHSSTSISAGLGYVKARDLLGEAYHVVSVIGDGALTGGMAYEAMNNAADLKSNFIIVLNDNNMSISPNVGGISTYLSDLRTAQAYTSLKLKVTKGLKKIPKIGEHMINALHSTKSSIKQLVIPGMFFENMGLTYLGPADGHDMRQMMKLFNEAKRVQGPVLVHVLTEKGRGYEPAQKYPSRFHGTTAFDIQTGKPLVKQIKPSYTDVFARTVSKLGDKEPRLAAVTAAMPSGTGLKYFGKNHPDRFFDVGIAEQHAVTFAAGLALGGMVPVVAIYSSFLQRAVDQILHDICMQELHVVFAVDRAGLVGSDGETHQGCFDLSYLTMMPGMTVMAPKNGWELEEMLKYAVKATGPIAVRYPRGDVYEGLQEYRETILPGRSELIHQGKRTAYLAVGSMVGVAEEIYGMEEQDGRHVTVVNARFVKPLDTEMLDYLAKEHTTLVTMEENVITGGFGEHVLAYMSEHHPKVKVVIAALPDQFVEQGNALVLKKRLGLSGESIRDRANAAMRTDGCGEMD